MRTAGSTRGGQWITRVGAFVLTGLILSAWPPEMLRAQSGPFSAQLQLLLQSANTWAAAQTFSNGIIVSGSCTGCGGGGGTPGGASGTIQYNNAGAFGGFGSWTGTLLQVNAGETVASDTGGTFQTTPTKFLLQSASSAAFLLAFVNAEADPTHYGAAMSVGNSGSWVLNAGKDLELEFAGFASDNANPARAGAWNFYGDLVDESTTATFSVGRASNPWLAVYAETLQGSYKSSDGTAGVTVTTCTAFKDGLCVAGT